MDLRVTQTIEHVDKHGGGCVWHSDNECLCDVDLEGAPFRVGDGPYNVNPGLTDRWLDHADGHDPSDEWFHQAWLEMAQDTTLKDIHTDGGVNTIGRWLAAKPEMVSDILDGRSWPEMVSEYGVSHSVLSDLYRVLGVPTNSKTKVGQRSLQFRLAAVRMYNEGASAPEIVRFFADAGVPQKHQTVCKWMQRYSTRYAMEKPAKTLLRSA